MPAYVVRSLEVILLLLACLLSLAVAPPPLTCKGRYLGCYKDVVPAPGVPPIRVVNTILDEGPVATMTVDRCAADCVSRGYYYAGLTGHVGHYYCYCSCSLNPAAPPEPKNSTCTALGGDVRGNTLTQDVFFQCDPLDLVAGLSFEVAGQTLHADHVAIVHSGDGDGVGEDAARQHS